MNDADGSRDDLAAEADQVRGRLLNAVEQLGQRRHAALDLHLQLHRHWPSLAVAGGLLVLSMAGLVAMLVRRAARGTQRRRHDRWVLAKRLWSHPERGLQERRPFFVEAGRSALVAALTSVVSWAVRRVAARAMPPPRLTEARGDAH